MPKKSNLAGNPEKEKKHPITETDLEETRAKILKASDELDAQLQIRLDEIENWRQITRSYPIELATGFFTFGFAIGSGMIGEIVQNVLTSSKNEGKKSKKRRSLPRRLLGLTGKAGTLAAAPVALAYLRKRRRK
jgi:hypothetical protein